MNDRGLYHGGNILTTTEMENARVSVYNTLLNSILSVESESQTVLGAG